MTFNESKFQAMLFSTFPLKVSKTNQLCFMHMPDRACEKSSGDGKVTSLSTAQTRA